MRKEEQIESLKNIGQRLLCTDDEFKSVLPNFPTLKGSEFIFTIGWANVKKYIDSDVEYLVRGLHIVENLYKLKTRHDFGFGSPSPTHKIIEQVSKNNQDLANKLRDWIAQNGGNYYIKQK